MDKTIARRTLILATAALTAVTIAVPGTAQASSVNGPISRGEVIDRAQYWVDQGYTYTQTGTRFPGPDGGQIYRRDCSGLVSMAWHLNTSLLTNEFLSKAQNGNGMHVIARDDLRPGDAMVRDSDGSGPDGHMELFAFWKNQANHSEGAYVYSFNSDGQTVQNPYRVNNLGNLGFDSWSEVTSYTPIRYDNIVGDGASQIYEAASDRGWGNLPVSGASGNVTGSAVAAMSLGSTKLVYTVNNGAVYEASSANGWQNGFTGISGVSGSALAVMNVNGTKFIYTVINGAVYEASSANGWQNGFTAIPAFDVAAIQVDGVKEVYTR
jgi:hypothetical protein